MLAKSERGTTSSRSPPRLRTLTTSRNPTLLTLAPASAQLPATLEMKSTNEAVYRAMEYPPEKKRCGGEGAHSEKNLGRRGTQGRCSIGRRSELGGESKNEGPQAQIRHWIILLFLELVVRAWYSLEKHVAWVEGQCSDRIDGIESCVTSSARLGSLS